MAGPVEQQIHRDPALFYWILLPITIVMILTGILRHYLSTLLQSTPKKQTLPKMREQRHLMRARNMIINHPQISKASFNRRKEWFADKVKEGTLLADGPEGKGKGKPNPLSDPAMMEGMMGMMKGQVAMMVPQSLIMGWINAFFSGYVIMKLPFPLTPQFKQMLQAGVGTRDLDVRWVSSLSWYFLTLFGLQPVYNFILGSNNAASQVAQQMQMQQGNPMGGVEDMEKIFNAEVENLEVVEHCPRQHTADQVEMSAPVQDSLRTSVHDTSGGDCAKRSTGQDLAATCTGQDPRKLDVREMIMLPVYNGAHRESGVQFVTRAELSHAIDLLISEELATAKAKTSGTKPHSTGATPEMKRRELYEHQPELTADCPREHHTHVSVPVLQCTSMGDSARPRSVQDISTDSLDVLEQPKSKAGGICDRPSTAHRPNLIVILRYA
ncbi:hypothetical protein LTR91_022451 [Friedmanniomyces endolithicus]|uniref:ER membrane protein complex subunit 3 n=2 Tax=Dothideomycetidae TaxID=451867 RepID=A0AAN6H883_9PEZI|nr:hypothetical protein LTR94_019444 [Friedmanniomyces endolithicus]KAK5141717.1 hypothetical protein LTR32_005782 [Rachicladosporium monterosium]KAK0771758.1 hypothetical protein LTR59_015959 [Friedmanniomyces endolithicus]KAK0775136.1 hypothetical protein LTR38_015969 [Friedmanniomyces endolithicus]KAK0819847.1 hypothetical protein LTR75_001874 [Friedmanniomyces endolithicus]